MFRKNSMNEARKLVRYEESSTASKIPMATPLLLQEAEIREAIPPMARRMPRASQTADGQVEPKQVHGTNPHPGEVDRCAEWKGEISQPEAQPSRGAQAGGRHDPDERGTHVDRAPREGQREEQVGRPLIDLAHGDPRTDRRQEAPCDRKEEGMDQAQDEQRVHGDTGLHVETQ